MRNGKADKHHKVEYMGVLEVFDGIKLPALMVCSFAARPDIL
jgi:hypothetical protein